MNDQSIIKSQLRLKEATLTEIAEVTSKLIFQNEEPQNLLSVKDVSGNRTNSISSMKVRSLLET